MVEIERLLVTVEANAQAFERQMREISGRMVYDPRIDRSFLSKGALRRLPISGPAVRTGDETFYPTIGYRWRFCWKTYLRNLWRALRGG